MSDPAIEQKIKQIMVDRLSVTTDQLTDEASFKDDLGSDSLDTVELIMEFEKAFDISIEDEDAEKITTVGECITRIELEISKQK